MLLTLSILLMFQPDQQWEWSPHSLDSSAQASYYLLQHNGKTYALVAVNGAANPTNIVAWGLSLTAAGDLHEAAALRYDGHDLEGLSLSVCDWLPSEREKRDLKDSITANATTPHPLYFGAAMSLDLINNCADKWRHFRLPPPPTELLFSGNIYSEAQVMLRLVSLNRLRALVNTTPR